MEKQMVNTKKAVIGGIGIIMIIGLLIGFSGYQSFENPQSSQTYQTNLSFDQMTSGVTKFMQTMSAPALSPRPQLP